MPGSSLSVTESAPSSDGTNVNSVCAGKDQPVAEPVAPLTYATIASSVLTKQHNEQGVYKNEANNKDVKKKSSIKRKPIFGTANDTSLNAAPRLAWLHVWKVAINTEPGRIENYIRDKIPDAEICCEKLKAKGNYASFKVGIPFKYINDCMKPDFWPEGVAVDRFFHLKKRLTTSK